MGIDGKKKLHFLFYKILQSLCPKRGLALRWWAWPPAELKLRCTGSPRVCIFKPNILALKVSEISAFIRTDMARWTRLVIPINNVHILCGRKRFLLPLTYFPKNVVYRS